jgi:hypothetical protein
MLRLKDCICLVALVSVAGFVLIGCSSQPTANSAAAPDGPPAQTSSGDSMPEGLVKLTDAERLAALKQAVCPVTGAKLGTMGQPPVITVNEQAVFLCCAGCEEELRKDPEKYLAKLKSE